MKKAPTRKALENWSPGSFQEECYVTEIYLAIIWYDMSWIKQFDVFMANVY